MVLRNRTEAGETLGEMLQNRNNSPDILLGINKGGVIVAERIAKKTDQRVNIIVVEDFGLPSAPNLDLGSITDEGTLSVNPEIEQAVDVKAEYISRRAREKKIEARKNYLSYLDFKKDNREKSNLKNKHVALVDDGSHSISSITASLGFLKKTGVSSITFCTPLISHNEERRISYLTDSIVCIEKSTSKGSIDSFYKSASRVDKERVKEAIS